MPWGQIREPEMLHFAKCRCSFGRCPQEDAAAAAEGEGWISLAEERLLILRKQGRKRVQKMRAVVKMDFLWRMETE
jgi:hypothetical protein